MSGVRTVSGMANSDDAEWEFIIEDTVDFQAIGSFIEERIISKFRSRKQTQGTDLSEVEMDIARKLSRQRVLKGIHELSVKPKQSAEALFDQSTEEGLPQTGALAELVVDVDSCVNFFKELQLSDAIFSQHHFNAEKEKASCFHSEYNCMFSFKSVVSALLLKSCSKTVNF